MTTHVVPRASWLARSREWVTSIPAFLEEVRGELKKVTWPDRTQLRQATIAIIIFVLAIGALIWLMDLLLQAILVRGIPAIFGAR
ncbi:MAG: preprotein translocase subunit SecE [Gemmatimonadaceae bacterium]